MELEKCCRLAVKVIIRLDGAEIKHQDRVTG